MFDEVKSPAHYVEGRKYEPIRVRWRCRMSDIQKAIEVIQTEKACVSRQQCDRDCGKCDLVMQANDILDAYAAAIDALQEKQHNDKLRKRLYKIFGGDVTLDLVVDELQRQLEEPRKPHPLYAKILTYEDADKWKKWKQAEQQSRLVELPCIVNDTVYTLVPTKSEYIIKKAQVKEIWLKHRPFGDSVFMLEQVDRRGLLFKYYESDFGKTVFFTHDAAEAALIERMNEEWKSK